MNSFFLILTLMPGFLLLPLSAEKILEGVHGKTGFAKLPPATSPLPQKVIFNPGQFTHCDSQQHLIYSYPAHKRKWQLQRKIHLELQFSQCLPHILGQIWFRHSCFLRRDLHVVPVWKQSFFAIIMFLVFKMFYLLQRQTDLQTNTLQTDFIEVKHPSQRSQLVTQLKTRTFTKLLHYISAIRSQQTAWPKSTRMSQHPTPWKVHTAPEDVTAGLHTDPTIPWQQHSCTGMFSYFSHNRGSQLLLSSPHQISEVTGNISPTTHM